VAGSVSAVLAGWRRGASVFRVHDVAETVAALQVAEAIESAGPG
jgi:dihydropteroate synthase